ncbi:MAG: ThiF family adenylyltransferase [Gammaproteobacteria bacterium]|nr:ThiF family adenylyltransferase [Gammaproteobacteria bacterium]
MTSQPTCDILIAPDDHARLMAHLFPGDRDEHGAVLHAGVVASGPALRLAIRHVEPAMFGRDYVKGKHGYRALDPTFIHHQITQCRDQHLAYLAVHNHDCDRRVSFSRIDLQSHDRGYPALRDIGKGIPVGALVFGRRSVAADVWLPDGTRRPLGTYRVIGQTIMRLYSDPQSVSGASLAHDRQVRMFGTAGQAVLGMSKVAVVGLGGVGSLVAEYLARLGVGHLVLIDPDSIEGTNLSRVVGATAADIKVGLPKTKIAVRHAREMAIDTVIDAISEDVTKESVAETLRDCDFIFLAADSMRARLLVNALVHQYLIPAVQIGAKIRPNTSGLLEDTMSAVRHIRPRYGCLWCNGLIDPVQLAIEAKTDEERKDQAYGVNAPNPSVITLNAVAAAHAVNDFLFDFLSIRSQKNEAAYQHFHFLKGEVKRVIPRRDSNCSECEHRFGMGDAMELPTVTG